MLRRHRVTEWGCPALKLLFKCPMQRKAISNAIRRTKKHGIYVAVSYLKIRKSSANALQSCVQRGRMEMHVPAYLV